MEQRNDKISVLIPMFNREKYITEAIKSIQNQTYKNLEIICYDDGSTDDTVRIVDKLAKDDNRIKLIIGKENHGVAFARNRLLENCSTDIACWHDSDDISIQDRIEIQIKELEHSQYILTGWNWLIYNNNNWQRKKRIPNHLASATALFVVNKKIIFNERMKIQGSDWDWAVRMQDHHGKTIEIAKVLYLIRSHDDRIGIIKNKIRIKFTEDQISKMNYAEIREAIL